MIVEYRSNGVGQPITKIVPHDNPTNRINLWIDEEEARAIIDALELSRGQRILGAARTDALIQLVKDELQ